MQLCMHDAQLVWSMIVLYFNDNIPKLREIKGLITIL